MEALALIGLGTALNVYRKSLKKTQKNINMQHAKWMMVSADTAATVLPTDVPYAAAALGKETAASMKPGSATAQLAVSAALPDTDYMPVPYLNKGANSNVSDTASKPKTPDALQFAANVRPADSGIVKPNNEKATPLNVAPAPGFELDHMSIAGMSIDSKKTNAIPAVSKPGSSVQILPPVLTGGAAEYGYSILQVRRNRSLDLRGDIKPFMPTGDNPCTLWRSSYAEQAKYNKPVTLIHNEIIPMPPTYDQIKNFFSANPTSTTTAAVTK